MIALGRTVANRERRPVQVRDSQTRNAQRPRWESQRFLNMAENGRSSPEREVLSKQAGTGNDSPSQKNESRRRNVPLLIRLEHGPERRALEVPLAPLHMPCADNEHEAFATNMRNARDQIAEAKDKDADFRRPLAMERPVLVGWQLKVRQTGI